MSPAAMTGECFCNDCWQRGMYAYAQRKESGVPGPDVEPPAKVINRHEGFRVHYYPQNNGGLRLQKMSEKGIRCFKLHDSIGDSKGTITHIQAKCCNSVLAASVPHMGNGIVAMRNHLSNKLKVMPVGVRWNVEDAPSELTKHAPPGLIPDKPGLFESEVDDNTTEPVLLFDDFVKKYSSGVESAKLPKAAGYKHGVAGIADAA